MTRMQLFKEMYELSCHNLICYSQNYLMNKPKSGYVKQWNKENEKVKLLQELISEEKQKEEMKNMSFTQEQILKMYPNTQYYVRNSNGGLLAGTIELQDAKKYAEKYKQEYLNDSLNNQLEVYVYDREGKNVYIAKGNENNIENEETEELE